MSHSDAHAFQSALGRHLIPNELLDNTLARYVQEPHGPLVPLQRAYHAACSIMTCNQQRQHILLLPIPGHTLKSTLQLSDVRGPTANIALARLALHDDGYGLRELRQDPVANEVDSEIISTAGALEAEAEAEEGQRGRVLEVGAYVDASCGLEVSELCVFEEGFQ